MASTFLQSSVGEGSVADTLPHIPPAGLGRGDARESTKVALTPEDRPETPPEMRKWRKSTILAPGQISKHPGYAEDSNHLSVDTYGRKSDEATTLKELLTIAPRSRILEQANARKEMVYLSSKMEPLGAAFKRGHAMPDDLAQGKVPFGKPTPHDYAGLAAKRLLAPVEPMENMSEEVIDRYKKSHGAYYPGEQRHRNYDWHKTPGALNPATHRFGKPGDETEHNAVYFALHPQEDEQINQPPKIVSKALEDFRETATEELGKVKTVGHGDQKLRIPEEGFGMPSTRKGEDDWNARQCLEGDYTIEDQAPDKDLGQSVRPGWRNHHPPDNRAFGVPNVRTDIPVPRVKSIADSQVPWRRPHSSPKSAL